MRVITGSAKGQMLKVPKFGARPTTDRVKEALFSILGELVENAKVLDLFAGSGALGIEALSRGAADCLFVEQDRQAARVIAENLKKTGLDKIARVSLGNALSHAKSARGYDLVFADAPYADGLTNLAADLLAAGNWAEVLKKDGLLVVECEARGEAPNSAALNLLTTRDYGRSRLLVFQLPV